MTSQFTQFGMSDPNARPNTPTIPGRGRGGSGKRTRKPRGASTTASPAIHGGELGGGSSSVQWAREIQVERGGSPILLAPNPSSVLLERVSGPEGRRGTPAGSRAGSVLYNPVPGEAGPSRAAAEDDGEGEDDLLPDMADDDYSAQLSWQSQSKDNLKYVPLSIYYSFVV